MLKVNHIIYETVKIIAGKFHSHKKKKKRRTTMQQRYKSRMGDVTKTNTKNLCREVSKTKTKHSKF